LESSSSIVVVVVAEVRFVVAAADAFFGTKPRSELDLLSDLSPEE